MSCLPLEEREVVTTFGEHEMRFRVECRRPTVLVVDDENGPRQSIRMLLKEEFDIRLAASGRAALQILESEDVDLIITDLRMPQQSGVELLRQVKEKHPETQVIILTGYGELETAMKAVEYGAFAYLEKPFDSNTLLKHVHAGVRKRHEENDRRALENLAMEANRFEILGRVVSGMIHDLASPLSVIGGHIDMLLIDPKRPDIESRLETMKSQIRLCSEIIQCTMSFLREQPKQLTLFNLNDVLKSCLDVAQPLVRRQRVTVIQDIAPQVPCCTGDFVLARQAVLNLITNACHAMKGQQAPQELTVRTYVEGSFACLSVGDTGPGVSEDDRERIFETFYTTKGQDGTGLGLAVVKHVMRQHNGDVILARSAGGGALFILRFPVSVAREGVN